MDRLFAPPHSVRLASNIVDRQNRGKRFFVLGSWFISHVHKDDHGLQKLKDLDA